MVAGRPVDRVHCIGRPGHPALSDGGLRRVRATADDRIRADATPVLLSGRQVDLHPAKPPQHLPGPRGGRPTRAGYSLPGGRALPRGADDLTRRQVPRLLPRERRVVALAPDIGKCGEATMSLASGTRLGPYEVLSPLGTGGMGEVYRRAIRGLEERARLRCPCGAQR